MSKFKVSAVLEALGTQFKADFQKGLLTVEPDYQKVAMTITANTENVSLGWLSHFPQMQKWVGKRVIKQMQGHGMVLKNELYESTVSVPRVNIEDDNVGLFRPMMQQAAQAAAELPDTLVFGVMKAGKETLCYDGQNFFDTDHPVYQNVDGTGTTDQISNLTTGTVEDAPTWFVLDTTNQIKPFVFLERMKPEFETKFDPSKSDVVFMEDLYLWGIRARSGAGVGMWQLAHMVEKTKLDGESLAKVLTAMQGIKADGGQLLKIRPNLLVVPPALEMTARTLLNSEIINGSTNIWKGRLELVVIPDLA